MSDQPKFNPLKLTLDDAADVLTKAGSKTISVEQLAADIEAGAPTNSDGTLNLVFYVAWLVKEMARGS